ncbi:transposase, partial [Streptomyces sp. NPDC006999]
MSCLRHPAGAHLRLGRQYQHDISGRGRHHGPDRVRRGRLPRRHRPRRGHQRQRRPSRRRRVRHHRRRIRGGPGFPDRTRTRQRDRGEGTSSYGAGFTRTARTHGHQVVEVNRPDRAERRRTGKSDPIDAYAAARAALSGRADSAPKDDTVLGIRALHNAARSAVKARTAALNQIGHVLITAPEAVRAKYGQLKGTDRTEALARLRPAGDALHVAVLTALRSLARRVKELTAEHEALTRALDTEVTAHTPGLRAAYGAGPDTAAQLLVTAGGNPERMRSEASFAALCGAAPVPASSGRTNRHRLSRGGDRAANAAL